MFINDLHLVLENTIIPTDLYTDDATVLFQLFQLRLTRRH